MTKKVYVRLKSGPFGCGVVGDNLVNALSALVPVERLDMNATPIEPLPGPLLERLDRSQPSCAATRYVVYSVFEEDVRARRHASKVRGVYDAIAAGSRWCEEALHDAGLTGLTTIHHGVDGAMFNSGRSHRGRRDRFVIFSGGKFELRKGQDIVAKAFRILSERHPDAVLLAAWHNDWRSYAATMKDSPYLPFVPRNDCSLDTSIQHWLADAGVDLTKVVFVPPLPQAELAHVYGASDVGLFPNRCEGATNLVLMEYMACGRAAIATDYAGHSDLLRDANCFPLRSFQLRPVTRREEVVANWCEPDVDEIVSHLEAVYTDQARADAIARQAGDDLKSWTWERAARRFLTLLQ